MAKKKQKEFKLINVILVILVIAIAIVVINNIVKENKNKKENEKFTSNQESEKYITVLADGTKLNNSNKLNEEKKLGYLKVTNIQLTYKNGITNLLATVTNTSKEKTKQQNVNIIILDEDGKELRTIPGIIEELESGESTQLNSSITADFANAYDIKITER